MEGPRRRSEQRTHLSGIYCYYLILVLSDTESIIEQRTHLSGFYSIKGWSSSHAPPLRGQGAVRLAAESGREELVALSAVHIVYYVYTRSS